MSEVYLRPGIYLGNCVIPTLVFSYHLVFVDQGRKLGIQSHEGVEDDNDLRILFLCEVFSRRYLIMVTWTLIPKVDCVINHK